MKTDCQSHDGRTSRLSGFDLEAGSYSLVSDHSHLCPVALQDRYGAEACIPPAEHPLIGFEQRWLASAGEPITTSQLVDVFEYVPIDGFDSDEHEKFLECAAKVPPEFKEGRKWQRFNDVSIHLPTKTHREVILNYYNYKYPSDERHKYPLPPRPSFENSEEKKQKNKANGFNLNGSLKKPKKIFSQTLILLDRTARKRKAASNGEEGLSDLEYAATTGASKRKGKHSSPQIPALKRTKTEPAPFASQITRPKKRKLSETCLEDNSTVSPLQRRRANAGEPKNIDEAFLKIRKLHFLQARGDGKTNSVFCQHFTGVKFRSLIAYTQRPAAKGTVTGELMDIGPEAFELIQQCLLLTWYLLQEQRKRVEPGKERNWGTSQWQLCAVGDANKVRPIGEAMEAQGMFTSDWCPELYEAARVEADLEKLADWEKNTVPACGKWPNHVQQDCRGYIVRRTTPIPSLIGVAAILTPPNSGGLTQEPSPSTRRLKFNGPNVVHPSNTPPIEEDDNRTTPEAQAPAEVQSNGDMDFGTLSPILNNDMPLFPDIVTRSLLYFASRKILPVYNGEFARIQQSPTKAAD